MLVLTSYPIVPEFYHMRKMLYPRVWTDFLSTKFFSKLLYCFFYFIFLIMTFLLTEEKRETVSIYWQ